MNECVHESMNECMNEFGDECMDVWMRVIMRVRLCVRLSACNRRRSVSAPFLRCNRPSLSARSIASTKWSLAGWAL